MSKPKWNRTKIGKITKKSKDKQRFENVPEFSLFIENDITIKGGTYLNLENKAFQLASLEANREKMSEENYEKAKERINKMPEFVFFEVLKVEKE